MVVNFGKIFTGELPNSIWKNEHVNLFVKIYKKKMYEAFKITFERSPFSRISKILSLCRHKRLIVLCIYERGYHLNASIASTFFFQFTNAL